MNKVNVSYFFNRKYIIYNGTYKPKFETEHIVTIIEELAKKEYKGIPTIFEIGSGSGCISISLKYLLNNASIISIEKDLNIYNNTLENCNTHRKKIICLNLDLKELTLISSDIVVSNPPYIKTEEAIKLSNNDFNIIRNIDGGVDGLDFVRHILKKSINSTYCVLELGYKEQKEIINNEFSNYWKIISYEKPINNLEVYFCVLKNNK